MGHALVNTNHRRMVSGPTLSQGKEDHHELPEGDIADGPFSPSEEGGPICYRLHPYDEQTSVY